MSSESRVEEIDLESRVSAVLKIVVIENQLLLSIQH